MRNKLLLILLITILSSCNQNVANEPTNPEKPVVAIDESTDAEVIEPKEVIVVNSNGEILYDRDVKDPQVMIDSVDLIVKVKVTSIDELSTYILEKNLTPYQKINFEVLEVLKGTMNHEINAAYQEGGLVPVDQLIEKRGREWAEKFGYDQYTEEESKKLFAEFDNEDAYDFKVGEEVVLGLAFEDDYYLIYGNGYSVFTLDDGMLKNVLTNAELESNKIK